MVFKDFVSTPSGWKNNSYIYLESIFSSKHLTTLHYCSFHICTTTGKQFPYDIPSFKLTTRFCFSYHHPQHLYDSIIERRVSNSCFDLNGEFSFLHGNNDKGYRSCRSGSNFHFLTIPLTPRGWTAHMRVLKQIHTHLEKVTKTERLKRFTYCMCI